METLKKLTLAIFAAFVLFGAVAAATNPVATADSIQTVLRAPIEQPRLVSPRPTLALIP